MFVVSGKAVAHGAVTITVTAMIGGNFGFGCSFATYTHFARNSATGTGGW